jgi:TonB family protein
MAAPVVYRVPRRFITFPEDPPPYGFLAVSFLVHMACFGAALALSAFLGSHMDQSKVYIVNLVPATPALGSPSADPPTPTVRAPESPRPTPPAPKAEEKAPPKAARPEPSRPPERVIEPPPPRAPEVAAARPKTLEPSELALPRRAEKENPTLPPPIPRAAERILPPPPPVTPPVAAPTAPAAPTRLPEPPRIAAPPAAPTVPAAPPVAARPAAEPLRAGRTTTSSPASGNSVSVDLNNFPFTYYIRQLSAKVDERWRRPPLITPERSVMIYFEIDRDGQIRGSAKVKQSSGNELYDQAALRAIVEASPFPPLPRELTEQYLKVNYEFNPGLDKG